VVVFRTDPQLANFIDKFGRPNSRYQNGEVLAGIMGFELAPDNDGDLGDSDQEGADGGEV
jgi:hypothetical protein